ncbi:MAG: D-alanine--poly(phosphoribitol) ligase, partial [Clostridia bacterium]|nr:D-alanine--poly(phosphoribitol) ligase [Clostridia bacterium]
SLYDNDKQQIVIFAESDVQWSLRKFNLELKKLLPPYMMPSKLVLLEKMPHTSNGKIDRVTLKKLLTEEN